MNEKNNIIVLIVIICFSFLFGIWTGYQLGESTANTRVKELESKLSDVQIINTELQTENTEHIKTIERIQGLKDESTRHIQLLESGIAELKGIGEAKDGRIIQLENEVRGLSAEIDSLSGQVERDGKIVDELIKKYGIAENNNNNGNINNSGVSWNSNNPNSNEVR